MASSSVSFAAHTLASETRDFDCTERKFRSDGEITAQQFARKFFKTPSWIVGSSAQSSTQDFTGCSFQSKPEISMNRITLTPVYKTIFGEIFLDFFPNNQVLVTINLRHPKEGRASSEGLIAQYNATIEIEAANKLSFIDSGKGRLSGNVSNFAPSTVLSFKKATLGS